MTIITSITTLWYCKFKISILVVIFWISFAQKIVCKVDENLTKPLLLTDEVVSVISSLCGQSNSKRIISTTEAELHEFPWMAYLFISKDTGTFMCGGFLITDRHIVTAAHCIIDTDPTKVIVFLGDHNRTDSTENQSIKIKVSTFTIHPNYNNPRKHENDVAILTLKHPIEFAINILPICLPSTPLNYNFVNATVAGWGSINTDGKSSDVLLKANTQLISNEECERDYTSVGVDITPKMICAGKDGKDTCQGDSGGPLMIPVKGKYFAIGIVSFGVGCGTLTYPGVYTRVDQLINFIQENTANGKTCHEQRPR